MDMQLTWLFQMTQTTRFCLPTVTVLSLLWSAPFPVCGQTTNASEQPDYSNIIDILDGRRTLLAVNDVVIGGLVLKTSDGTQIDPKDIHQLPGYNERTKNSGVRLPFAGFLSLALAAEILDTTGGTLRPVRCSRLWSASAAADEHRAGSTASIVS
jgi:hypothetical protein